MKLQKNYKNGQLDFSWRGIEDIYIINNISNLKLNLFHVPYIPCHLATCTMVCNHLVFFYELYMDRLFSLDNKFFFMQLSYPIVVLNVVICFEEDQSSLKQRKQG